MKRRCHALKAEPTNQKQFGGNPRQFQSFQSYIYLYSGFSLWKNTNVHSSRAQTLVFLILNASEGRTQDWGKGAQGADGAVMLGIGALWHKEAPTWFRAGNEDLATIIRTINNFSISITKRCTTDDFSIEFLNFFVCDNRIRISWATSGYAPTGYVSVVIMYALWCNAKICSVMWCHHCHVVLNYVTYCNWLWQCLTMEPIVFPWNIKLTFYN